MFGGGGDAKRRVLTGGTPSVNSPRSRHEDNQLLFPGGCGANAGRSPMLPSSPGTSTPFAYAASPFVSSYGAPPSSTRKGAGQQHVRWGSPSSFPRPSPAAAATPFAPMSTPRGSSVVERPPLFSMLDAAANDVQGRHGGDGGGGRGGGDPPYTPHVPAAAAASPGQSRTFGAAAAGTTPYPASTPHPAATPYPASTPYPAPTPYPAGDGTSFWITVFGYHTNTMLPAVLDEMRPSGGEIVQHLLGAGPWMHVQFRERWQQQRAIAKNGTVLRGVMLGVIEGVVPSDDGIRVLNLPSSVVPGTGMPLKVQLPRAVPGAKAPGAPMRDHGRAGWWTRTCEVLFGW